MSAIDAVIGRLEPYRLREHGRHRWRACCPAHGGKNPSSLSIGVGGDGQVLLKCWHGCGAHEVAQALGLDMSDLFPPKPGVGEGAPPIKRRRLITASQAIEVLATEINVAAVACENLANGICLNEADRARLVQAAARVLTLRDEVGN